MKDKIEIAKRNFFSTCIADMYRAVEGNCLLGSFTLAVCAVGALSNVAHVAAGSPQVRNLKGDLVDKPDNQKFREWVQQWITNSLRPACDPTYLYAIRCALAHTYGASDSLRRNGLVGYLMTTDEPHRHWERVALQGGGESICLNLEGLIAEISLAAWNFFDSLTVAPGAETALETELGDLIARVSVEGDEAIRRFLDNGAYRDMHPAMDVWDSGKPDLATVSESVHRLYKEHKCKTNSITALEVQAWLSNLPNTTLTALLTGGGASQAPEALLTGPIMPTRQQQ